LRSTLGTPDTLAMGGGHAHCGTLIYLGDRFPASYRNTAFMCNVHGHRINNDILKRKGSGYVASHGKDFMIAADMWRMGVTLRPAPDGNVFVSDWSDTGECHTYKPNKDTGRIYKISYGSEKAKPVNLGKLSDRELVDLQGHSNDWYVCHARRILQERAAKPGWNGEATRNQLRECVEATEVNAPSRLRGLWPLHVTGGTDTDLLVRLLDDKYEHIRAWAIQLLCERDTPSAESLRVFATLAKHDPSP